MAAKVTIDYENYGRLARALQQRLGALGVEVKLGHAYEALAALAGDANWHVLKARIIGGGGDGAPDDIPAERSLASALEAAAFSALQSGTLSAEEAQTLFDAAQGNKEAVCRLAADCGHVVVASLDVREEVRRWNAYPDGFVEKHAGAREPFDFDNMKKLVSEFSQGMDYTRSATGDFFSDWLYERIGSGNFKVPAPIPR